MEKQQESNQQAMDAETSKPESTEEETKDAHPVQESNCESQQSPDSETKSDTGTSGVDSKSQNSATQGGTSKQPVQL
jgi:hypothetical protein